jgi:hypothetical protein
VITLLLSFSTAGWLSFKEPTTGFVFSFPSRPVVETQKDPYDDEPMFRFRQAKNGCEYQVVCNVLPPKSKQIVIDTLARDPYGPACKQVIQNMLGPLSERGGAKVLSSRFGSLQNWPAQIEEIKNQEGWDTLVEAVVTDHGILLANVSAQGRRPDEEAQAFFKAIKLPVKH